MFGYVQANVNILTEEEKERYKQVYCGLCHSLGEHHGFVSRFGLTYDMAFLALLLSSLYEPTENEKESRCVRHPVHKHRYVKNKYIDYAADMTVALVYFKCIDDWNDDKNIGAKGYASLLSSSYKKIKDKYPRQCGIIEKELKNLSEIEKENEQNPDSGANCFGRLMEDLFVLNEDMWSGHLRQLGYGLGRYIYLADATIDLEDDKKSGSYNPLKSLDDIKDFKPMLELLLGEACHSFDYLPLVQDENILKNILYSGIWNVYNSKLNKGDKTDD